jgi:hypothetical protein
MRCRRFLWLVLTASLVAGCGSSRLSSNQLRSQATAVCSAATRQTKRIPTPRSPAEGRVFLSRGIAVLTPELARLRRLEPPADVADVYRTSVQAFSHKLAALRATVHELRSGANPVTAMAALEQRLAPIESSEDGAWRALEVSACMNR